MKALKYGGIAAAVLSTVFTVAGFVGAQTPRSANRIKVVDINGLLPLLKPSGKPLLVNFWATWCDPCREEFPDLVKINAAYRGKLDVITVSFDDLADLNGDVPKFLTEMKADMPAYLLHTPDEDGAIQQISKDWAGNLPLTILYDASGKTVYFHNSKFHYPDLIGSIDKLMQPAPPQ